MIGNLKAGADSAESDIGQVIYRMKMLGFNAIRLPFTFAALAQVMLQSCNFITWRICCIGFLDVGIVFCY